MLVVIDYVEGVGFILRLRVNGPHRSAVARSLGCSWDRRNRCWVLPKHFDFSSCAIPLTEAAKKKADEHQSFMAEVKWLRSAADAEVAEGDGLDGYQKVGVKFLTTAKKAILCDFAGAGKTAQAVRAAMEVGAKRVLVITRKSLIHNWLKEVEKWGYGAGEAAQHSGSDAD